MDSILNAHPRYVSYITTGTDILGCDQMVDSITHEDMPNVRKELLTGYQICGAHQRNRSAKKGRTVRTVNVYVTCMKGMFNFVVLNGYIGKSPLFTATPLKKSKLNPSPPIRDEYHHFLGRCLHEQIRNLWKPALSTGMRYGGIYTLVWGDIDIKNWTIRINRNLVTSDHFTLPKIESGNRTVDLTTSAIEALESQMACTRMRKQHQIDVHLKELGRIHQDKCTSVFVPRLAARDDRGGKWYSPGLFSGTWNNILKRNWIPHRRLYEPRHTYTYWALSTEVNPNFIAAQVGHTSVQMICSVYGKWMLDSDGNQLAILNVNFGGNVPQIPHA